MKLDILTGNLIGDDGKSGTREFMVFLKQLKDCAQNPRPQNGTTANRPTRYLEVGMMYYDTTLGYPVFVHTVNPIVWHNAAGIAV